MMKGFLAVLVSSFLLLPAARGNEQLQHRPIYTLHIGDVVELDYRLTPEFNQTVTVEPDGNVDLQVVGNVKAAGLTLNQFHDEVVRLASNQLNNPVLSITLKQFVQPYVVVAGEVHTPGKIEINDNTTALQAVMLAGGFMSSAKETQVILFRHINGDTAEVHRLNLHNIKKHSQLEHDMELEPGDMLLVTRNRLENLSRFMKATDLGLYFNPTTGIP